MTDLKRMEAGMGHKRELYGWTDYPTAGDEPGKPAPWRKCKATAYDGNKYVAVLVYTDAGPRAEYIKAAYVRTGPGYRLRKSPFGGMADTWASPAIRPNDLMIDAVGGGIRSVA